MFDSTAEIASRTVGDIAKLEVGHSSGIFPSEIERVRYAVTVVTRTPIRESIPAHGRAAHGLPDFHGREWAWPSE